MRRYSATRTNPRIASVAMQILAKLISVVDKQNEENFSHRRLLRGTAEDVEPFRSCIIVCDARFGDVQKIANPRENIPRYAELAHLLVQAIMEQTVKGLS